VTPAPPDTSPEVAEALRRRVLARSGSDRVRMAARMFHTAKVLGASRVLASGVVDDVAARLALLVHLYGADLTPSQYAALRVRFEARGRQREAT